MAKSAFKFAKADELVKTALRRMGINAENFALFDIWEKEAGKLAQLSEVLGINNGILKIRVSSPLGFQELMLSKAQLVRKINQHYGKNILRDIKVLTSNERE